MKEEMLLEAIKSQEISLQCSCNLRTYISGSNAHLYKCTAHEVLHLPSSRLPYLLSPKMASIQRHLKWKANLVCISYIIFPQGVCTYSSRQAAPQRQKYYNFISPKSQAVPTKGSLHCKCGGARALPCVHKMAGLSNCHLYHNLYFLVFHNGQCIQSRNLNHGIILLQETTLKNSLTRQQQEPHTIWLCIHTPKGTS